MSKELLSEEECANRILSRISALKPSQRFELYIKRYFDGRDLQVREIMTGLSLFIASEVMPRRFGKSGDATRQEYLDKFFSEFKEETISIYKYLHDIEEIK